MSESDEAFLTYVAKIQEYSDLMQKTALEWINYANLNYETNGSSRDAQIQSLAFGATVAVDNFKKYVTLMSNRVKEIQAQNVKE